MPIFRLLYLVRCYGLAKKLDLVYNIDLNITFRTYRLCLISLISNEADLMTESKKTWTELARQAPLNPQSDKPYHPSTLEKVYTGKRNNALLKRWLHGMEIQDAQTKKGTGNTTRKRTGKKGIRFYQGEITELSRLTEAIRGKANSD